MMRADRSEEGQFEFQPIAGRRVKRAFFWLAVLVAPLIAQAGDFTWDNGGGTGLWSTAENWSSDTVPTVSDTATIGAGGVVSVTNTANAGAVYLAGTSLDPASLSYSGGGSTLGTLVVGSTEGSAGSVQVGSGQVSADVLILGSGGTGTLTTTGGTTTFSALQVGSGTGSSGKLSVQGGSVYGSSASISIAMAPSSQGAVEVKSGVLTTGSVSVGMSTGSVATVDLSGGYWFANSGEVNMGMANGSTTTFNVTGGQAAMANLNISFQDTAASSVTVSGGGLVVFNKLSIGTVGNGKLTVSGAGQVTAAIAVVGENHLGGELTVKDGGTFSTQSTLTVGNGGAESKAAVTGAGKLTTAGAVLGANSDDNSVTVSGFNSVWQNNGALTLGSSGSEGNTVTVTSQGLVKTNSMSLFSLSDDNFIRLDGGFFALQGDQLAFVGLLLAAEKIQLWDGAVWVTATEEDLGIEYYTNDAEGTLAGLTDTGYNSLANYTVVTAPQAVPEPGSVALLGLGAALVWWRRR